MLTFGRQSSADVLKVLKEKAIAFEHDPLNEELANQCAIDAWSLCDWVFNEHGTKLGIQKLSQLQAQMKQECPFLSLFQDVANASKHKEITLYAPRLKEAKSHRGAFNRGIFDNAIFDVSELILISVDNSKVLFEHALKDVINHWEHYFAKNHL